MERAHEADAQLAARILTLRADIAGSVRDPLLALQGSVLVLILIACANIANLLLAKSSGRRRELAIRAALGAGTARLARMLLTESLLLGLAGCLGGPLLAWWSASALAALASAAVPDADSIRPSFTRGKLRRVMRPHKQPLHDGLLQRLRIKLQAEMPHRCNPDVCIA